MFSERRHTRGVARLSAFFAAALTTICPFPGCSVKEDRSGCPCRVCISLEDISERTCLRAGIVPYGSVSLVDTVLAVCSDTSMVFFVPHCRLTADIISPPVALDSHGRYRIDYGSPCAPVYMFSSVITASGEYQGRSGRLCKNHSVISMRLLCDTPRCPPPFSASLTGNICGYGPGGELLEGPFLCTGEPSGEDDALQAVIPRQKDASLMLEVTDARGVSRRFALGQYINSAGCDWSAEDLEDYDITIDFASTAITAVNDLWTEPEYIRQVI